MLGQGENKGHCVLEVSEIRAEAAERARNGEGHSQLLRPRSHCDRLDPVGYELRVTGQRRDPQARFGRQRRESPQEVEDVGLIASAMAPEHVGVDDDELLAHPSAFR